MPGPNTRESIAASPIAELVIPPSDAAITMLLCAIPARICPVRTDASFMTRSVIPVSLSKLPAKMNNGMASRRNFVFGKVLVEQAWSMAALDLAERRQFRKYQRQKGLAFP